MRNLVCSSALLAAIAAKQFGTYADANATLDALEALGVSYNDVVALLESEGLDKFVASWKELLGDVEGALASARKAS